MIKKESSTYTATILIAGPIEVAKQFLRKYCKDVGMCVTIAPTTYIYTMGEEIGYSVGLINYPRFPKESSYIWDMAVELGKKLLEETHQGSFTVQATDKTAFFSIRECDKV